MAVIKIVPMPGAEGQQGETGAVGPQGPQGETGATGPAGADAVWYYNGEYNPGAAYVVGDVVTYDGQLWYRKNANGGNVGDTPSEGLFWDLLAAKGAQGDTGPAGQDSLLPTSGTWDLNFNTYNNDMVESSPSTHTIAEYYTIGDLVFIEVHYVFDNVTSYGTGGFTFDLPFPPIEHNNSSNFSQLVGTIRDMTNPDLGRNIVFGKVQRWPNPNGSVILEYQLPESDMELYPLIETLPASLSGSQNNPWNSLSISGTYRKA